MLGHDRPSWPTVMIVIAELMAQRSTCPRAHTGAVVCTPEHQILTTGYNGSAAGQEHCMDVGCLMYNGSCIRAHHAEANAITQAAKLGIPLRGAILYCTHRPCIHCIKLIIQAGITAIVYTHDYHSDQSYDWVMSTARRAGITMDKWEEVLG